MIMSTPLHIAINHGYYDAMILLLRLGADPNKKDRLGFEAIHLAAIRGYTLMIEELLRYGVSINAKVELDPNEPISLDYDIDLDHDTPLHLAVLNGHTKLIKRLIHHGANINICNFRQITPLHVAIHEKLEEIIRLLLEHGANIHKKGLSPYGDEVPSPLAWAIRDNTDSIHMVRILLQYRKTKRDVRNAVILAVRYGNVDVCKYLLDTKKANANTIDKSGRTLLHNAVIQHDISCDMIKLLISKGANKHAKNSEGKVPIQLLRDDRHHAKSLLA